MTTVAAIGFPDESTASAAAEHVRRATPDLALNADNVAVITRDDRGTIHVTTSHQIIDRESSSLESDFLRGVFWLPLFSALCLVPLLQMPVGGSWQVLLDKIEQAGLVDHLQKPILEMLQPGTSILFLAIGPTIPVTAVTSVQQRFGGSVVTAELSRQETHDLHEALHGLSARPTNHSPGS